MLNTFSCVYWPSVCLQYLTYIYEREYLYNLIHAEAFKDKAALCLQLNQIILEKKKHKYVRIKKESDKADDAKC